jgi:2-polyprenyl-3-methyl-5-hydroxy-6-metoxy-1,4-benzoquinol methylase
MSDMQKFPGWFREKWNVDVNSFCHKKIINQYYQVYLEESTNGKVYGKSSEDLLEKIFPLIKKLNPKSIIDYGCGRSSLINYFWNDGKRKLYKYDPAIPEYVELKTEKADLVICTDVLEHLPEFYTSTVVKLIKKLSDNVIFTISLIPARKKLPSGINAHITIRPAEFWIDLIGFVFDNVIVIEQDNKGLFLKTWN